MCVSAASTAVFGDWVTWYSIFQWIYGHQELALIIETREVRPYMVESASWRTKLNFFFSPNLSKFCFSHCTCSDYLMYLHVRDEHKVVCISIFPSVCAWTLWQDDTVYINGWIYQSSQPNNNNILFPNVIYNRKIMTHLLLEREKWETGSFRERQNAERTSTKLNVMES